MANWKATISEASVRPLNQHWRPIHNPGSVKDYAVTSRDSTKYLEHLTYHGGLDAAVWKRGEPGKKAEPSEEFFMREDDSDYGLEDRMKCLWKAKTSDHTDIPSERIESWLEKSVEGERIPAGIVDDCREEEKKEKCSACGCRETQREETKPEADSDGGKNVVFLLQPLYEESKEKVVRNSSPFWPIHPSGWPMLFAYLFIVFLYRLFMDAAETTCALP